MTTNRTSQAVEELLLVLNHVPQPKLQAIAAKYKQMEDALRSLTEMRKKHEQIFGYEKQHFIINRNTQWADAEDALAFDPLSTP